MYVLGSSVHKTTHRDTDQNSVGSNVKTQITNTMSPGLVMKDALYKEKHQHTKLNTMHVIKMHY